MKAATGKSKALTKAEEAAVQKWVTYFKSEECAQKSCFWMDQLIDDVVLYVEGHRVSINVSKRMWAWMAVNRTFCSQLIEDLVRIELARGVSLTDMGNQNVPYGYTEDSIQYYRELAHQMSQSAAMAAELAGFNINAELGYVVY